MPHFTGNGTDQCQKRLITPPYSIHIDSIESNLDRLGLLSPTHGQRSQQQSGQNTLQSVLINRPKFLKAARHTVAIRKIEIPRSMGKEALSW